MNITYEIVECYVICITSILHKDKIDLIKANIIKNDIMSSNKISSIFSFYENFKIMINVVNEKNMGKLGELYKG